MLQLREAALPDAALVLGVKPLLEQAAAITDVRACAVQQEARRTLELPLVLERAAALRNKARRRRRDAAQCRLPHHES